MRHLEEAHARLLLADEAAGDVLHEDGEVLAEPRPLLAEEGRLGDAAGVDRAEGDPGLLVVLVVQQVGGHHEAQLRVLVRLGAIEVVAVEHRDRVARARLETLEVLEVGDGVDAAAADSVVVTGDGADEDDARVGRGRNVIEQQAHHQEVAQVVDLHLLLVAIHAPLRIGKRRLVDGGVADQPVERPAHLHRLQLVAELADRVKRVELDLHRREVILVEALDLRHGLHLIHVTHCTDDVVPPRAQQRSGRLPAQS